MRRPSRIQSKRISNTPSRSGPRNVFGRMITRLERRRRARAPRTRSSTRRTAPTPTSGASSDERMHLRHAVHRRRRDVDDAPHAGARAQPRAASAVPSTLTDMISRREPRIGSAAAAWIEHVGAVAELARRAWSRMSPRISVTSRSTGSSIGTTSSVRTSWPLRDEEPREVQAEKACTSGDRVRSYRRDRNRLRRASAPAAAAASSRRAPPRRAAPPCRPTPRRAGCARACSRADRRARRAARRSCDAGRPTRARPRRATSLTSST